MPSVRCAVTASERARGRQRWGRTGLQGGGLGAVGTPCDCGLAACLFSALVCSWVSSYSRVDENKDNTQGRTLSTRLIECSENISSSRLHLRERKLAILSKGGRNALRNLLQGLPSARLILCTCGLGFGPPLPPSVFHPMGRVTPEGLVSGSPVGRSVLPFVGIPVGLVWHGPESRFW